MINYPIRIRPRKLATGLRQAGPTLSDVIAARLRAEQDDVIARWAGDLPRRARRWLAR